MPFLKLKEDPTPHPRKWWHLPLLIILFIGTALVIRQRYSTPNTAEDTAWNANQLKQTEGTVFGTFYHITYQSDSIWNAGIEQTMKDVDNSLSPFNPKSVISAINKNTSDKADKLFTQVFLLAKEVSNSTHGAFDITVAPLVNHWGFGFEAKDSLPDNKARIDSLLQFVGFEKVSLKDEHIIKTDSRIILDCSAIAKGFGVDQVGRYLESKGVKNYMVEIGGEVRVRGYNPKGKQWHIGINKPQDDPLSENQELQDIVEVENVSMATSGNYRNFYIKNNKKYAHTIDPRTGYPVQHSILSATVFAQDCATADAYATAFMVLGLQEAKQILNKHTELKAYFIFTNDKGQLDTWHSKGLKIE